MGKIRTTRELQYQICIELEDQLGLSRLGLMSNQVWQEDPRRLVFMLARYKFVSKMLSGMKSVLEVGCADAFGTRIVLQEVERLTAIDFDPVFIEDTQARKTPAWEFECLVHDILEKPVEGIFDAAYALDVLEHIPKKQESLFIANIVRSLTNQAVLIIGTPSIQSQLYASAPSKEGHVNCQDHVSLKNLMAKFFHNVFLFSMNDEVVHTGFYPMAHYLIALCCSPKRIDVETSCGTR
jgi:2-polyprenyl-3-methyl-5-hydroxy-6-metoxy-1,4-benzoquinol methylase